MKEEEWQDEVRRRDEIIDALMALVKRWKCFGAIDPVNASHLIADSQRLILKAKADAQVAGASRERKYDTGIDWEVEMNKEKAKYYSELLLDMAEVEKYDYGIMADAANFIELQQKELDRLNRAIDNCSGGSLTSCCCNFNDT